MNDAVKEDFHSIGKITFKNRIELDSKNYMIKYERDLYLTDGNRLKKRYSENFFKFNNSLMFFNVRTYFVVFANFFFGNFNKFLRLHAKEKFN